MVTIKRLDGNIRIMLLWYYYKMMRSFARLLIMQSGIDVFPSSKQEASVHTSPSHLCLINSIVITVLSFDIAEVYNLKNTNFLHSYKIVLFAAYVEKYLYLEFFLFPRNRRLRLVMEKLTDMILRSTYYYL